MARRRQLLLPEFERRAAVTRDDRDDPRRHADAQIAYHGPGLTFGELAIGDAFTWPPPLPPGRWPLYKRSDTMYTGDGHVGRACDFYRVERWRQ